MDRLVKILLKVFNISEIELKDDLTIGDIASWDSLTHMDLIAAIETEFDVVLTGDEIADMISIASIKKVVLQKVDQ